MGDLNQRKFPRIRMPILWRRADGPTVSPRTVVDISGGGVRLYADQPHKLGEDLELEVFMPDGVTLTCRVEVVWAETLEMGAEARFEIGVKFVRIAEADQKRIVALAGDS